jgi:O-antigen ligase
MLSLGAIAVAERFSARQMMLLFFCCCGMFLLIGFFAELTLGTFTPLLREYRYCGTNDPNVGSWSISFLLLIGIYLASTKKRGQIFYWIVSFIAMTFLILSKTRTSFAAFAIVVLIYWSIIKSKTQVGIFLLGIGWLFCLFYLLFESQTLSIISDIMFLGRKDVTAGTLSGRIPVWSECLKYIAETPFLGHGYYAFWTPTHIIQISSKTYGEAQGVSWALNGYIDLVLCLGIIGAASYILILILAIKKCISAYKLHIEPTYALACSIIVFYSLIMFFESICFNTGIAAFVVFAILAKVGFGWSGG